MNCQCFKCEKAMEPACDATPIPPHPKGTAWDYPLNGILFEGGYNFGSRLYDAMMDGVYVEVIICDECMRSAQGTDRMRERRQQTPTGVINFPEQ